MRVSNHGGWNVRLALKCLGLAALAACEPNAVSPGRDQVPPSSVIRLDFSETTLELADGDTARVALRYTDVEGRTDVLRSSGVRWSSTDASVVSVDGTGRIVANEAGTAEVMAQYGNLSAILRIIVEARNVRIVKVSGDGQTGAPGARLPQELVVRVEDAAGRPLRDVVVGFMATQGSSRFEPAIARTDASGTARTSWTLGSAPGEYRAVAIPARSSGIPYIGAQVSFRATATTGGSGGPQQPGPGTGGPGAPTDPGPGSGDPGGPGGPGGPQGPGSGDPCPGDPAGAVASVRITKSVGTFNAVGRSAQFEAVALAANGSVIAGVPITWTSSNPGVASVDALGRVTAKAVGTAVITAAAACCADAATIEVRQVPASVVVTPAEASAPVGGTVQLSAEVRDSAGTAIPGASVQWSSANTTVATVDNRGLVSVRATGEAEIRATAGAARGTARVRGVPGGVPGAPQVSISVVEGAYDAQVTAQWQLSGGGTVTAWYVRGSLNGQVVQETTLPASQRSSSGTLPRTSSDQEIEICVQAVSGSTGPAGCAKAKIPALSGTPAQPPTEQPNQPPTQPPPPSNLRAHEPAGLNFYAEHTLDGIPGPSSPGRLGSGARWLQPESTNRMQIVPSTAGVGGPSALRVQWQRGLQGGTYPHSITLQHPASREVYASMYVNFLGAPSGSGFSCRFENHPVQTKWFYWMYEGEGTGHLGGRTTDPEWSSNPVNASKFWLSWQWTDGTGTQEIVPVQFDWRVCQWHHVEMHLIASDPGQSNGRVRIWVDGQLIADRAVRTSPAGGKAARYDTFTWRPVWGGTGFSKTRDDYADIAYIYVSGR